jgi:NAD(P)-dependent dehydrogenase (short-subunit alcohol dehydrogenase family)
VGTYQ